MAGLARTFVSFSSTDIRSYHMMCAWKAQENIDFNFYDLQLEEAINSTDEEYIKRVCRAKLDRAGTYVLLIGTDTRYKTTYVKWEAQVAMENECRLIAVNLDHWRVRNPYTCPDYLANADVMFVPFSPHIVQWALENFQRPDPPTNDWFFYQDWVYTQLGYTLDGYIARRPPKISDFWQSILDGAKK
jgi:hypothetical protein